MMSIPAWLTRRPLLALASAAAVLGLALGWVTLGLPKAASAPDDDYAWRLPALQDLRRFDDAAFQATVRSKAWPVERATASVGRGGAAAADGATASAWALVGIVANPEARALILVHGETTLRRLALGGELPDGSRITHIRADAITVSDGSCQTVVRLYRIAGKDDAPTCSDGQAPVAPNAQENDHE